MVILTFDDQLVDGRIAGLLTRDYQWLQGAHIAYQMQLGSHEGASCLQQKSVAATQTNQDTKAADTIDTPPYLKRKLMRHDDRTTVSDDSDWVHSDHSDEEEEEVEKLGVGRIGEYPPRIRWLRKRHLRPMTLRMAAKCMQQESRMMVLARPQSRDSPRSGKRSGGTETTSSSLPYNSSTNGSKRQRCSFSAIQQVKDLIGGTPANVDGAGVVVSCRDSEVPAPHVTELLSEANVFGGPRRSQRIREKPIGSACGTRRHQ